MTARTLDEIPAARKTDPLSSHEAAERVTASGKRQKQADVFLAVVQNHPGLTSAEIAKVAGYDRYAPARRLPELQRLGLITQGLQRACSADPRHGIAVTWWPKERQRGLFE